MAGSGAVFFGRRARAMSDDDRAVARLLASLGPVPGDAAAGLLGWSADRWWGVVSNRSEWFDLTGKGWALTEAGRGAVGQA
jgi:hypothetical protein